MTAFGRILLEGDICALTDGSVFLSFVYKILLIWTGMSFREMYINVKWKTGLNYMAASAGICDYL